MSQSAAIVTGSRSGIGRATAIRRPRDFSAVALAARGPAELREVAGQGETERCRAAGDRFRPDGRNRRQSEVSEVRSDRHAAEPSGGGSRNRLPLKPHGARPLTPGAWQALRATKGVVVVTAGNTVTNAAIATRAKAFADWSLRDGIQVNSVSPAAIVTRQRPWMTEKGTAARKVHIDEAEEAMLTPASNSRYGEPQVIGDFHGLSGFSCRAVDDGPPTSHRCWRGDIDLGPSPG